MGDRDRCGVVMRHVVADSFLVVCVQKRRCSLRGSGMGSDLARFGRGCECSWSVLGTSE